MTLVVHFLSMVVLAQLVILLFRLNMELLFLKSVKNCAGIFMQILLYFHIAFGRVIIFTTLILRLQKHGGSLHFLISFLFSFFKG